MVLQTAVVRAADIGWFLSLLLRLVRSEAGAGATEHALEDSQPRQSDLLDQPAVCARPWLVACLTLFPGMHAATA